MKMIIYSGTKHQFNDDVINGLVADKLKALFKKDEVFGGSPSEIASWQNSLTRMVLVLNDDAIPEDSEVALEYQIPTTAKRIDFMIAGQDIQGHDNVYMIELKQWSEAEKTSLGDCVKTFTGGADRIVQHPCAQIYNYAKLIENTNASVYESGISLYPAAFLHNYEDEFRDELTDRRYQFYLTKVPMFLKHDTRKLTEDIKRHIARRSPRDLFEVIDHGKLKPSRALQDEILPLLEGNQVFYMIDEQQVAYSTILKLVKDTIDKEQKYTIIVQGGPGTGKSVIAVSVLAQLLSLGYSAAYVTKNSAPRNVFGTLLVRGHKKLAYIKGLFKGSGSFVNETKDRYDCLLVDEAHRLNDKSGLFRNQGENQIKEIIHAAKISVFFLDEDQIVTVNDIGTLKEIEKWAKECGSKLIANDNLKLISQFRCNGSNGYISFIDNLLQIRPTANRQFDLDFDFRVYDDPTHMREDLRKLNGDNKARMVAGYCYDWNSKKDPTAIDIRLDNGFQAQWNFNSTSTWAIDKDSFDQVGCIHTCQGLEFDYIGVIIGKDLAYRDGKVVADVSKRSKMDHSIHGLSRKANAKELGEKIVRDTYKTLMTRGQKGCFVYCEDKALGEYIQSLLSPNR